MCDEDETAEAVSDGSVCEWMKKPKHLSWGFGMPHVHVKPRQNLSFLFLNEM